MMVYICLAQGMALLGGVALLEKVWPFWKNNVIVGMGFWPLPLAAWMLVFSSLPSEQEWNSQLLQPHDCLDGAMLLP